MSEDYDYDEDESLIQLSEEQLEKFDSTVQRFINDQSDSKNLWFLIDNISTLEDNLNHIKKTYYDNFPRTILKSKYLLDIAQTICSDDTVKELLKDAINKIDECLERLGISKDKYSDYSDYYKDYKYGYPEYDKIDKYSKEYAKGIMNRNVEPLSDNGIGLAISKNVSDVHEGKIRIPEMEKNSPEVSKVILESIQKLNDRKIEYLNKKKELKLTELSKIELSKEQDSLTQFRNKLLMKCIDNMIEQGRE